MEIALVLTLAYILFVFSIIKTNEFKIEKIKAHIFLKTDERFKEVQKLIDDLDEANDYETTFLNEIVKLRTQAKKYKEEKKHKNSLSNELKIGKILNNLSKLTKDFDEFKNISEEKIKFLNENFIKSDMNIKGLISSYNVFVSKHNRRKASIFFLPYMLFFKFSFKKIDILSEKP